MTDPVALDIDHLEAGVDALLAGIEERRAERARNLPDSWLPEREPWRRAGRLWSLDLLAVPAAEPGGEVSTESADHRRLRCRLATIAPALHNFRQLTGRAPAVMWAHTLADHGAGPTRVSYGEVTGWRLEPDGVHLVAVSCIEPRADWSCSIGSSGIVRDDDDAARDLTMVGEVSLLPPPLVPALPGARVVAVEPFEGTVDDVAWLGNLRPAPPEPPEPVVAGASPEPRRRWPRWR